MRGAVGGCWTCWPHKHDRQGFEKWHIERSRPTPSPPKPYVCEKCRASGCKLWRLSGTISLKLLWCLKCTLADAEPDVAERVNKELKAGCLASTQIGPMVAAVPCSDQPGVYWGFTSVPTDRILWWKALPN